MFTQGDSYETSVLIVAIYMHMPADQHATVIIKFFALYTVTVNSA